MSGEEAKRKNRRREPEQPEVPRPDVPPTVIGRDDPHKGASAIPVTRGGRHPQQVDMTTRGEQD